MSTRHVGLERSLEDLVEDGIARWVVTIEGDTVVIQRRGDDDGFVTANRIADEIDSVLDDHWLARGA